MKFVLPRDESQSSDLPDRPRRRFLRESGPGRRERSGPARWVARVAVAGLVVVPAMLAFEARAQRDDARASVGKITSESSSWVEAAHGLRRHYSSPGDGSVTGVRIKAVTGGPSLYLVSLWAPEGTLLSWASTGPSGADGWRTATFSAPVPVKASKTYTLSYWASPRAVAAKANGAEVQVQFTPSRVPGTPSSTPSVTHSPSVTPSPTRTVTPVPMPSVTKPPAEEPPPAGPPTLPSFPNAGNTGVPAGVSLKASGGLTVTKSGTVLDGLDISGVLDINASNVTVKNSRIRGAGWAVIRIKDGATGVVIQDSDVDGLGVRGNEGSMGVIGPANVLRCDIHGVENGVTPDSGALVQDNFIHDLGAPGAPHYDGIQIDGSRSNIVVRHNTVLNQFGQTAAIMIDNYFGPISNITVDGNHLGGGGYTVYSDGQFSGGSIGGVRFTNNHLTRGSFGYSSIVGNTVVQSGNVDATTKAPVRLT